jgi:hypothetical protein
VRRFGLEQRQASPSSVPRRTAFRSRAAIATRLAPRELRAEQ